VLCIRDRIKIDLPALTSRRDQTVGNEKERLDKDVARLTVGLDAIQAAEQHLYKTLEARFFPDLPSDAYRSARAALPDAPVDRHILPLLALAMVIGLVFGGVGVAVDRTAGVMLKLRELWGYRELIRNLVLRDLQVRYKGSALGYLWTQLAPLLMMLVFWFVFSFFFQSASVMYPVFLIVGLLPWNFCSEAVNGGTRSVLDNANLIKKVFFPREVLPLVSVFSSLVNYILSLPMIFLLMAVVQLLYPPLGGRLNFSWTFAYIPVLIVIETLFLAGVALFTSALAVFFRDFVHLIGILLQFWFFLTPVVYSLDTITTTIGGVSLTTIIRWLNPMASLIDFYRDILYGNVVGPNQIPTPGLPALNSVLRVLITALITLAVGYWFFQRRSGRFGEEI
jgi:lipopolysaccharide transport system permease protein